MVRSVNVDCSVGFVVKRVAHKALRRQMVALVRFNLLKYSKQARLSSPTGAMQMDLPGQMHDRDPVCRIL